MSYEEAIGSVSGATKVYRRLCDTTGIATR